MLLFAFIMCLAAILSIVFAVITLVKRIQKKTYATHWIICKVSMILCLLSFVIAVSSGQWNMMPLLVAILLVLYGVFQLVVFVLRKIIKQEPKNSLKKALISMGIGLCMGIISIGGTLASILDLFACLFFFTAVILLIVNVGMVIAKRKNKLLWLSVPACVVCGILLLTISDYSWNRQIKENTASGEIYETPIQITYDFEVVDGDTPIQVIASESNNVSANGYVQVYEEADLHLALEKPFATAEACMQAIEANSRIDPEFKLFLYDFVERIEKTYPGMNLAILYNNLETLDIEELSANDYFLESLSIDSLGCYKNKENTVYVEGEFGFQVLMHEFCHAARTSWFEEDNTKYRIEFYDDSDNLLLAEAMNSVFSCSLLDYYEWDIAYQVPSNYLRIMLECMDNYVLEDYMRHRDTYFLSKLDEFTGNTNYAQVIWKLIALQRSDWESDNIDIPEEEYYAIYDFLCQMYYDKYLTDDMTDEEKRAIADELVHKAFYDAPEDYKIAPEYFYEYLGL